MEKFKVFYKDAEVAGFNYIEECNQYIAEQVINDKSLMIRDFIIYKKI